MSLWDEAAAAVSTKRKTMLFDKGSDKFQSNYNESSNYSSSSAFRSVFDNDDHSNGSRYLTKNREVINIPDATSQSPKQSHEKQQEEQQMKEHIQSQQNLSTLRSTLECTTLFENDKYCESNECQEFGGLASPVPLNRDEQASAEVRALAAKLAPVLFQADEMLARELFGTESKDTNVTSVGGGQKIDSIDNVDPKSDDDDDDDDMDDEMNNLERSEFLLRQELESALLFGQSASQSGAMDSIKPPNSTDHLLTYWISSIGGDREDINSSPSQLINSKTNISGTSSKDDDFNEMDDFWIQREMLHNLKITSTEYHDEKKDSDNKSSSTVDKTATKNSSDFSFKTYDEDADVDFNSTPDNNNNHDNNNDKSNNNDSNRDNKSDQRSKADHVENTSHNILNTTDAETNILINELGSNTATNVEAIRIESTVPTSTFEVLQPTVDLRSLPLRAIPALPLNSHRANSLSNDGIEVDKIGALLPSLSGTVSSLQTPLQANLSQTRTSSPWIVKPTPPCHLKTKEDDIAMLFLQDQQKPLLSEENLNRSNITASPSTFGMSKSRLSTPSRSEGLPLTTDQFTGLSPYTIKDHLEELRLYRDEHEGLWYTVDVTSYYLESSSCTFSMQLRDEVPEDINFNLDNDNNDQQVNFNKYQNEIDQENYERADHCVTLTTRTTLSSLAPVLPLPKNVVTEYCISMPEFKLRRMHIGLRDGLGLTLRRNCSTSDQSNSKALVDGASFTTTRSSATYEDRSFQVLPVRTVTIRIRPDVLCGAVMEAVSCALVNNVPAKVRKRQGGHFQAFVRAEEKIVQHQNSNLQQHLDDVEEEDDDIVSVASRAADKAVADAAAAYGLDLDNGQTDPYHNSTNTHHSEVVIMNQSPDGGKLDYFSSFLVDVQLTTYKSDCCERLLLIRIYHDDMFVLDASDDSGHDTNEIDGTKRSNDTFQGLSDDSVSSHLRECSSLIQRFEAPESAKRLQLSRSQQSLDQIKKAVSDHLKNTYKACPSVQEGNLTLPSLNNKDYDVIKSSWRVLQAIWEELESRDLAYSTLNRIRFGAFPSLPTLDVHYCSQLRTISRDEMIVQLLKSASELEAYAREAEWACANMIALLRPAFTKYNMRPPALPVPAKSLSEYPLEYTIPQEVCPPWGGLVQTALSRVQEMTTGYVNNREVIANGGVPVPTTPSTLSVASFSMTLLSPGSSCEGNLVDSEQSFEMAQQAVAMVLNAFRKQDDEEQAARLGRKNAQVMDRISNMQRHEKLMIHILEKCYSHSNPALEASSNFRISAGNANISIRSDGTNAQTLEEVPLLRWGVIVGRSNGICTITSNYILFVTQYIPIIGSYSRSLFRLSEIEFQVASESVKAKASQSSPSLLSSLLFSPNSGSNTTTPVTTTSKDTSTLMTISILQGDNVVFQFKPVVDGLRLKSFLDVIQALRTTIVEPIDDLLTKYYNSSDGDVLV